MATDSRGSRLLSDLNSVFRRDPEIDEYDFLPVVEPRHNRSPLVLQEHKLGLELWSVKVLYHYAYNTLMSWRLREAHAKFLDPTELLNLSRAVVLVNADCCTAWNIRKELVESGDLNITDDLKLGSLILSKHPKSPETFSHRKWLLRKYIDCCLASSNGSTSSTGSVIDDFVNMDAIDLCLEGGANNILMLDNHGFSQPPDFHEQMKKEIAACRLAAEKYPCNYNAWSHRSWVVQHCYNCNIQILFGELYSTETWVKRHVSDHSGFHYRQFLLTNIHKRSDSLKEQFSLNYRNLIQKEMQIVIDLIKSFHGHEALWYHRRYIFQAMCQVCDSVNVAMEMISLPEMDEYEKDIPMKNSKKKTKLENEKQILLSKEVNLVSKSDLGSKNAFHKGLAQKYIEWIQALCRS